MPIVGGKMKAPHGVMKKDIVTKENETVVMKEQKKKKTKSGHIRLPYHCGMVL